MVNYWLTKQEPSGPRGYNFSTLEKEKTIHDGSILPSGGGGVPAKEDTPTQEYYIKMYYIMRLIMFKIETKASIICIKPPIYFIFIN